MALLKGDEKARYVASMFDRISGRYDLMNTVMTGGLHHLWRWKTTAVAVRGGGGEALDIATGTGDLAWELADRPTISRVVGLDFAAQMLAQARRKARKHPRQSDRVHWARADAVNLPFQDDRFWCVTCGFGLRNFYDIEAALREMARVIVPGGRVVILDIVPVVGSDWLSRLFQWYFRKAVPWLGSLLAGSREAYAYLPESVEHYMTPQELAAMMERVGLRNVGYRKMGLGTVAMHAGEKPVQGEGVPEIADGSSVGTAETPEAIQS